MVACTHTSITATRHPPATQRGACGRVTARINMEVSKSSTYTITLPRPDARMPEMAMGCVPVMSRWRFTDQAKSPSFFLKKNYHFRERALSLLLSSNPPPLALGPHRRSPGGGREAEGVIDLWLGCGRLGRRDVCKGVNCEACAE